MKWGMMLSLLAGMTLISCKDQGTTQPPEEPIQHWRSLGIHNYTIDQTRTCFCINGGEKMRLTVTADTISQLVRLRDTVSLNYSEWGAYKTVEAMLSIIQNSSDSLVVRYNGTYGYPEYLDINPQLHPVDGGALYESTGLTQQ